MNGAIVYGFATPHDPKANILYVNVVPRYSCTNSCRFCSRKAAIEGKVNIYEKKAGANLWLPKAPMAAEVVRELEKKRTQHTNEIAFVGLGEPLLQFDIVKSVIAQTRRNGFTGTIRIDTNGLVKCWNTGDTARELKVAGLDEARISVNETTSDAYLALCRPRTKRKDAKDAFEKLCEFVRDCVQNGIDTFASFVVGFDDGKVRTKTAEEYAEFAVSSLRLSPDHIIIRQYVPPI